MLDRAKNRATPSYFRKAVGAEYLFYTGNTKDPKDSRISVASSLVRLRLVRVAGVQSVPSCGRADDGLRLAQPRAGGGQQQRRQGGHCLGAGRERAAERRFERP